MKRRGTGKKTHNRNVLQITDLKKMLPLRDLFSLDPLVSCQKFSDDPPQSQAISRDLLQATFSKCIRNAVLPFHSSNKTQPIPNTSPVPKISSGCLRYLYECHHCVLHNLPTSISLLLSEHMWQAVSHHPHPPGRVASQMAGIITPTKRLRLCPLYLLTQTQADSTCSLFFSSRTLKFCGYITHSGQSLSSKVQLRFSKEETKTEVKSL